MTSKSIVNTCDICLASIAQSRPTTTARPARTHPSLWAIGPLLSSLAPAAGQTGCEAITREQAPRRQLRWGRVARQPGFAGLILRGRCGQMARLQGRPQQMRLEHQAYALNPLNAWQSHPMPSGRIRAHVPHTWGEEPEALCTRTPGHPHSRLQEAGVGRAGAKGAFWSWSSGRGGQQLEDHQEEV